jgi:hypothetical protein
MLLKKGDIVAKPQPEPEPLPETLLDRTVRLLRQAGWLTAAPQSPTEDEGEAKELKRIRIIAELTLWMRRETRNRK